MGPIHKGRKVFLQILLLYLKESELKLCPNLQYLFAYFINILDKIN